MMKRLSQLAMLCIGLFFLYGIAYAASVPQIVSAMGRELDRQVAGKLGQGESPAQGLSLFVTTPVDVNNLSKSVPLARQVQEELMRWFVQAGYPVYEIRKSEGILFDENTGEMALTRQPDFLESGSPASGALLVGTYTVTARNVRFNVRVMQTADQNVIAMSTITIPINPEIAGLLTNDPSEGGGGMSIEPTVLSYLP